MKKIFSTIILSLAALLSAVASQTFSVTSVGNSQTVYFRINKTSGSVVRSKTTASGSSAYVELTANETYYQTFAVTTGSDTYKTITFTLPDDVTYLEVYNASFKTNVAALNVSGMAAHLASLNVSGCSNLSTLTLGTMAALTDVNVSGTKADVANAFTASNSPALENLNVANCGISSFTFAGTTLYALDVTGNSLTTLNLSAQTNLDILRCQNNQLTSLKLPASISTLSAEGNALTSVTGFGENMQVFDVASNELTELNVSELGSTTDLDVSHNHLTFRSLPSQENKPARIIYSGNDGVYDITSGMRPAYGSYSYPLQSRLPNYTSRTDADYTIDLSEHLLDGNNNRRVSVTFQNGSDETLKEAKSDADGNDYTIDSEHDYYGFIKAQEKVRAVFTDSDYPLLTLKSDYFIVPDGVTGTLKIVDEDGSTLFTKENAFFSDATDGLPEYALREYTKYTIPDRPTVDGGTWTITAGPSDDAPFAWAKTYGSAVWYYMSVGSAANKWATAGERNGTDGTPYGGHALKESYSTSDDNYQWAFVGNQYEGFKIYNKGCGNGQTLQDYSGSAAPLSGGRYPIMRNGTSLTWIVRTNSAGTGFSLENKGGGLDNGVDAPCYINNYSGMGYMNYWITSVYDAQNNSGSLINVTKATDPVSACVRWVMVDENDNAVYNVVTDADKDATISSYPTELTTLAANRFVTLPELIPFTVSESNVEKRIEYTWTGPFTISTDANQYHYKLKIRDALYIVSDTRSDGALDCVFTDDTSNPYRWMFYGDPFNGFIIRNFAKGTQGLSSVNGTDTGNFPTFADVPTRWIITSCTRAGIDNPFSISPAENTGMYWNQYGGTGDNGARNQGIKYYSYNGTNDGGSAIEAILIDEIVTMATITWNVIDANNNVVFTTTKDYGINANITEYPEDLLALKDRFIDYPALSDKADRSKTINVTYEWVGPYELTTDINNPKLYRLRSSRYAYYAHAPRYGVLGEKPTWNATAHNASVRDAWFFVGDPFNGIEIRTYTIPTEGINATWALTETPQKFIPRSAPDITTNYYNNALPSAACGFVVPGLAESNYSSCISESGGTWHADAITSDKGCSFTFEPVDAAQLIRSGYYRIRSVSEGFTTDYISMESDGALSHTSDNSDDLLTKAFRLDEQDDFTWRISHTVDGVPYYLDNTKTSYSQSLTSTSDVANAFGCTITYDSKVGDVPFFRIKVGSFSSYDGYSYMNINSKNNLLWTWNYASGSANDNSAWTFEPVELPGRTVDGENYYTTAYMPFDYTLPAGVKAYTITVSGQEAVAHELTGGVPAGTAVLIVGDQVDNFPMHYASYGLTSDDNTLISQNALAGTYTDKATPTNEGDIFIFSGKNNTPGFYIFTGSTLSKYKAYLPISTGSGVRGFTIVFGEEGLITGLQTIIDESAIGSGSEYIYDLQGRRVTQPQKGNIYIIDGRKVLYR